MRKIILFVTVLSISYKSFSQQDSLLRSFKYRIDSFRAININAGTNNQYIITGYLNGRVKSNHTGSLLGFNLNTIKSTDKILLTTSAGISSVFDINKGTQAGNENKNRSFNIVSQFGILNKWFSGKSFIELGGDISASHYYSRSSSTSPSSLFTVTQNNYAGTVYTGIGEGRLENITDMQNALWLNKALAETKRLSRNLSADELNELGRSITKGNNTRVLDFRKRTQFLLQTVDEYLQKKELISKNDIVYFSDLNDILFFAFNNSRLAGKEKFIRLSPSVSGFDKTQTNINGGYDKFEQNPLIKSALLSVGFNNYIPVNLKHQNNYGAALKLSYLDYRSTEKYFYTGVTSRYDYNTTVKQAGVNLFFQHAIYPNTRTSIDFQLQSETGYQHIYSDDKFYGAWSFTSSFNYFISYRTRFVCDVKTAYYKNMVVASPNFYTLPDYLQLNVRAGVEINL